MQEVINITNLIDYQPVRMVESHIIQLNSSHPKININQNKIFAILTKMHNSRSNKHNYLIDYQPVRMVESHII